MNINELKTKLKEMNILKNAHCLEGGLPNDTYCIEKSRSGWEVYYGERGKRIDVRVFGSEKRCAAIFTK